MNCLLNLSAEEISGIIGAVAAGIVSIVTAVATLINNNRKKNCDDPKCCITGRKLKAKKQSAKSKKK